MSSYVSADLRRLVARRAEWLCEYCLIDEESTYLGCTIDHIVSEKHGGTTIENNLAYACAFCNRAKGTDLGSISGRTGLLVAFFNPRTDRWSDHFLLEEFRINALTEVGEVTGRILAFNDADRLLEREMLYQAGVYPSAAALGRVLKRL